MNALVAAAITVAFHGFLLRRIPLTVEWKLRALARRASYSEKQHQSVKNLNLRALMSKHSNIILSILSCVILILAVELLLRIFLGYPHGYFNLLLAGKDGLYPRNSTLVMTYGFKPYAVTTNSFGMRSKEIPLNKTPGVIRIMALGDSVTDGYFVGNESTYPYMLDQILNARGKPSEVLNVAKGGGSIDKEFALLKATMPLKPDIVLLTFVTNDIADIKGRSKKELLSLKLWIVTKNMPDWVLTKTAIGEFIGDLRLKAKYKNYRLAARDPKIFSRYETQENEAGDHGKNVEIFNNIFDKLDGIVMKEPFSKEVNSLIDNYSYALKYVNRFCLNNSAVLVFIYFPNYAQIYDPGASLKIRDVMEDVCKDESIPFLDTTVVYRSLAKKSVLHFAPFDFHCNPEGNRLLAETIANFLFENSFFER